MTGPHLAGRVAVVTGGATGVGRAIARRLSAEGATVIVWDSDPPGLHALRAEGAIARTVAIDVSDHVAVERATEETVAAAGGRLDILVCTVASAVPAATPAGPRALLIPEWRRSIDVNLNGAFYCYRAALPHLVASGRGRIVNVAAALDTDDAALAAAKAGVLGLTRVAGHMLEGSGVGVMAMVPGRWPADEAAAADALDGIAAGLVALVADGTVPVAGGIYDAAGLLLDG